MKVTKVTTLAMLLLLMFNTIVISIPGTYGNRCFTIAIRNLGGEYEGLNATMYNITDINLLNLINSLLLAADMIKEYNASLSNDLKDVANLIVSGEYNEAIKKYEKLLPQILNLAKELQDVDPEVISRLLSILPSDLENAISGEPPEISLSIPSTGEINVPMPGMDRLSSNLSSVGGIEIPYLNIILPGLLITIILVILVYYRNLILETLSPVLSKHINKALIRIKLGSKPNDPRGIIIYNYNKFLLILAKRGLKKHKYETPREFMKRVDESIFSLSNELTKLFEIAKYSHRELTSNDAARSDEIISAIEGEYRWVKSR